MSGCPHCPDGHADPLSRPWGVYVSPQRDSDGQPTHLVVQPSAGHHVAESDAEWLWTLIRGAAVRTEPEQSASCKHPNIVDAITVTNELCRHCTDCGYLWHEAVRTEPEDG